MKRYVVFFKDEQSKIYAKDLVTTQTVKDLKKLGFRKYHIVVEAENEKDALRKIGEFNSGYLDSLKDLSGSAVICAVIVILMAIFYLIRT
ncbi:hypothetical protein PUG46_09275 [Erwiniaceae bacterium L1_55_4]|nr:hypothetical protein [Erwiniaceae bacterium L1_55_4]